MQKRLFRSNKNKIIAGVAGGLGEYFDVDPVIIRIIFVVTGLMGGSGLLAYIICWIIIPQEPVEIYSTDPKSKSKTKGKEAEDPPWREEGKDVQYGKRNILPGLILIVIGGLFLANNLLPRFRFGDFWPILLIVIGIGILYRSMPQSK